MDERTERLRDIFMDVADEAAVTEGQAESRGTLATDRAAVDDRLAAVVEDLREDHDFETDLSAAAYVDVVRGFYDARDDAAIAADLDRDPATVTLARADLHLVSPEDADVDTEALRDRVADDSDPVAAARALGSAQPELDAAILAAIDRSRRLSHRFRTEFEEVLTDADLTVRLTAATREDGLEEATEDAEVDVDF